MSDIPLEVFTDKWAMLNERFGEDKPSEVRNLYYEQINARLSEEEFVVGVDRVAYSNRFFPSPKQIVDAARGGDQRRTVAHEDWRTIVASVSSSTKRRPFSEWIEDVSRPGRKALETIGGAGAVAECPQDRLNLLRRDFVDVFEDEAQADEEFRALQARPEFRAIEGEAE